MLCGAALQVVGFREEEEALVPSARNLVWFLAMLLTGRRYVALLLALTLPLALNHGIGLEAH